MIRFMAAPPKKTSELGKATCPALGGPQEPTSLEGEQVAMVLDYITKLVSCKAIRLQSVLLLTNPLVIPIKSSMGVTGGPFRLQVLNNGRVCKQRSTFSLVKSRSKDEKRDF